jgi:iron complex transport system substrate-binding protein
MRHLSLVLAASLLLSSCRTYSVESAKPGAKRAVHHEVPLRNITDGCIEDFRTDADYFPDKITAEFAEIFKVTYHKYYKVVRLAADVTASASEPVSDTMVLVQCGAPVPRLEGDLKGAAVIPIPVLTIAANDNCDIAAIHELGFEDRIVAIGGSHIYNEKLRKLSLQGTLPSIGYAWHGLPNSEYLLANPPDVLFMRRATLEHGSALSRARALGIKAAPTVGRSERHYLGFAEWIKYFAVFLNSERKAQDHFSEVAGKARSIADQAKGLPNKPAVIWAGFDKGGMWSAARSPLDMRAQYLEDAGGNNLLANEKALPSGLITTEELLARAAGAEFWIAESVTTKGWPDERFLNRISAYLHGNVYHHEKRSIFEFDAYDWYETGAMRPDLVLQDLVALFHPELKTNHATLFFDHVKQAAP